MKQNIVNSGDTFHEPPEGELDPTEMPEPDGSRRDRQDPTTLDRALRALADDVTGAAMHLTLYRDLRTAALTYSTELNQAGAFWTLTISAHADAVVARLARAFDQRPDSLSLRRLTEMVAVELDQVSGSPPPGSLQTDQKQVSSGDPLVRRLLQHRGNLFAHMNANNVLEQRDLEHRFGLTLDELFSLSERAVDVLNRYGQLLRRQTWSRQIVGQDDYMQVLRAIRHSIETHEAAFQAELAELERRVKA